MNSLSYEFRSVRAEVVPKVPYLATSLAEKPGIIRREIMTSLEDRGVTLKTVPEPDINKLERHIIAGWAIAESCSLIVAGTGRRAHFWPQLLPVRSRQTESSPSEFLREGLMSVLGIGVRAVEHRFTHGQSDEHQIWPVLRGHYAKLGVVANLLTPDAIPQEGDDLHIAVSSPAISRPVIRHVAFIDQKVAGGIKEKLAAAHDTAGLVHGVSGHHLEGVGRAALWLDEIYASNSTSVTQRQTSNDTPALYTVESLLSNRPHDPERTSNIPLLCAARVGDNLRTLIHAGINVAPGCGYFKPM